MEKITDADGKVVSQMEPVVKRQVIREETSALMCGMMEKVVMDGTGRNAYVAGYRVGGKTGTSQKLDSVDENARIASFVGIAPANDPKIAVLIALDEPHSNNSLLIGGGAMAAPVAAKVIEDTLQYMGEERQYTPKEQQRIESTVTDQSGRTLEAARASLQEKGFAAKIVGHGGAVVSQDPAADSVLPRGSTVLLYTEEGLEQPVTLVPAATGLTLDEATELLHSTGLNVKATGAVAAPEAVVVAQSSPEGESLPQGSLVTLTFFDYTVPEDEDFLD